MLALGRENNLARSIQEPGDGYGGEQVHRDGTHSSSLRPLYKIKHRKCRNKSTVIGSEVL